MHPADAARTAVALEVDIIGIPGIPRSCARHLSSHQGVQKMDVLEGGDTGTASNSLEKKANHSSHLIPFFGLKVTAYQRRQD